MTFDLVPYAAGAVLLIATVLALYIWRRTVATHEDDTLHVLSDSVVVPQQVAVAHKLERIDRWGKLLTAVTAVYVVAIAFLFVYQQWIVTSRIVAP